MAQWLRRDTVDARIRIILRRDRDAVMFVVRQGRDRTATRRLAPAPTECADLRAVVAVTVALAIDATLFDAAGRVGRSSSLPAPEPSSASVRRPRHTAVGAEGLALLGVLPGVAFGVASGLDLDSPGWPDIRVIGMGTIPVEVAVGQGAAHLTLVGFRLDACLPRTFGRLRARACLGAVGAQIHAQGHGFATPHSANAPWSALAARLDLRFSVSEVFSVQLGVDAYFPVLRPRLEVRDGTGGAAESTGLPQWGAAAAFGPVLHFR